MDVRNRLYDRGVLRSYSLGARTISVGNLTTGGTGKTPLVALIARLLADHSERVCILTRGYGRVNPRDRVLVSDGENLLVDAATGGDEPVELARSLIGKAVVVADADRVSAAEWAREKFGITTFILDDGFQHRRAKREFDIVCIDATDPCGNGHILPAGTLRESFKELRRADAIVITRSNLVDSIDGLAKRLRRRNAAAPIFKASTRITRISSLDEFLSADDGAKTEIAATSIKNPYAFCGLGNPGNFKRQLEDEAIELSGFKAFGDHHRYVQSEVDLLQNDAISFGASELVTTAKDAVKLDTMTFSMPVFVVEVGVSVDDAFGTLVLEKAGASPPS